MALDKFTVDVQNVQGLNDRPNANTGLTADEVKAVFDKGNEDIKEFINATLTEQIDAELVTIVDLETNRKLSDDGNFTGSWFGITSPSASEPGIQGQVDANTAQIVVNTADIELKAEDSEVRKIVTKIELADLSSATLSAMTGGATVNVTSTPGDRSITPTKTNFISRGKNLYNKLAATNGGKYDYSTGLFVADANYNYSERIAVTSGLTYFQAATFTHVCYFNANNTYLSGVVVTGTLISLTPPADCTNVIISSPITSKVYQQFELGSSSTTYAAFTTTLNDDILLNLTSYLPVYSYFDVAYILNRRLIGNVTNPSNVNGKYTGVDIGSGKAPISMKCKAVFSTAGVAALISNPNGLLAVSQITSKSVHIVFTNLALIASVFDGGVISDLYTHTYSSPCLLDNTTEYTFKWSLSGNTMTFVLPDGTFTNTNVLWATHLGRYCTLENYWTDPAQHPPGFTFFEVLATDYTLRDNFKRQDGSIGVAPTGQTYVLISEQNQTLT